MWNKNRSILVLAIVAVLGLIVVATACGSDDDADESATDTPSNGAEPTVGDEPVGEIDLEVGTLAARLLFSKTELTAPAGEDFAITYDNTDGGVPHNIAIYASQKSYQDGEPAIASTEPVAGPIVQTLDVPALDAGDYLFMCLVHPTTMTGTLHVIE